MELDGGYECDYSNGYELWDDGVTCEGACSNITSSAIVIVLLATNHRNLPVSYKVAWKQNSTKFQEPNESIECLGLFYRVILFYLFIIALQYNMTYTYNKRLMTVTNVNNCCIDGLPASCADSQ